VLDGHQVGDLLADADAVDHERLAIAVVRHHEDPDRVAAGVPRQHARGGADPTFEVEALHPDARADASFFDRAVGRRVERSEHIVVGQWALEHRG
jgi:hypothetical protein